MSRGTLVVGLGLFAAAAVACGNKTPSKYPSRPDGCQVTVYPDSPSVPTENIGTVQASCEESVSEADCLRELQDQACHLGADVVWGVGDKPSRHDMRLEWHGRAAHTKGSAGEASPAASAAPAPSASETPAPSE